MSAPKHPTVETREGDKDLHPKALAREEQAIAWAEAQQNENRSAFIMLLTSTALGFVAMYPIVRGTRTDNHTMLLIGAFLAVVAFKILPIERLPSLIKAWRGRGD